MFEIVVGLCLLSNPDVCRAHLVPGPVFEARVTCEQVLLATGEAFGAKFEGVLAVGEPKCQPLGAGLLLTKVSDGVYVHKGAVDEPSPENHGDVANLGVVIGNSSIAVVDTGGSRAVGEQLYRAIRQLSPLPISHVVLTHMHPDHVLGASVFVEVGAVIIAHPGLRRALLDRQQNYLTGFENLIQPADFIGTTVALPTKGDLPENIDLGGRVLQLRAWPISHTSTDITVYDAQSGTLFAGDLVFDHHAPALDGSLVGWISVLKEMSSLKVRYLIPGHGGPILKHPDGLIPLLNYLQILEAETRQALANGERLGEAAVHVGQSEAGNWDLFEVFNHRNATAAYTELEWD
ncbi:quinoprotein relay system zinc metallohydrolase 2 [Roseibium algae]|uniref:Quinoprotein relay system zinc metallohydrolase 2 n=1 Tax=Roseibium algae TaxID=3123038 RepID=A0ABU8TN94_9HYPH